MKDYRSQQQVQLQQHHRQERLLRMLDANFNNANVNSNRLVAQQMTVQELQELKEVLVSKLHLKEEQFSEKELHRLFNRVGTAKLNIKNLETSKVHLEKEVQQLQDKIKADQFKIKLADQNLKVWEADMAKWVAEEEDVQRAMVVQTQLENKEKEAKRRDLTKQVSNSRAKRARMNDLLARDAENYHPDGTVARLLLPQQPKKQKGESSKKKGGGPLDEPNLR